jgi:uncharacterized protein YgfB (UPF0149 family)
MADFTQLISNLLPAVGGAAGTALAGPIGGMAGSQLGQMVGNQISGGKQTPSQQAGGSAMGMGIGQMLSGLQSKKQAQGLYPSYEDPRQLALLSEINQKRKSLETGADFAEAVDLANQAQAATQAGIIKSTGGDVGGTIQGLLQSERNTQGARNQAYATGAAEQRANTQLYNALLDQISARKLQLQMQRSQQKMAEWAQSMKEGRQNFLAGLANTYQEPNITAPQQDDTTKLIEDIQFKAPMTEGEGENDVTVAAPEKFNFEDVTLKNNYGLQPNSSYGGSIIP